jgi:hypothetical protein
MAGHTGGFVDDDQLLVLVPNVERKARVGQGARIAQLGTELDAIATSDQVALVGSTPIAAYLARLEQSLDLRAREREPAAQHTIEPNSVFLFLNLELLHRRRAPALLGAP